MLRAVRQDIHFAVRQFRRSPGFAAAVVLTLGLGIGATTAIFTLVDGILLRPLPFPHQERLVAIDTQEFPPGVSPTNLAAADYHGSSYPNFFDWQRQSQTFDSLASYDDVWRLFSKADGSGAGVIQGGRVSANLFSTLGVLPALGRTFTEEEQQPGHRVVILSHELWVSDFGASPNVIGQLVRISDEPSTIVGVMPAGFRYPVGRPAYFWATYAADTEGPLPRTSFRDDDRLSVVGRLKSGIGIKQALADLNRIQRGLAQQYSENRYRPGVAVTPLLDSGVSDVRPALNMLFAAVGMLLVIGCANVAGLLLARANARQGEIALRAALGASRGRVVRQLFVEALLLALAGGGVGCIAGVLFLRAGLHFVPGDLPRLYNISFDGRVLAFAVLVSAGTALMFGLLPAWRLSKSDPANALRECGTSMTTGRHRNRLQHSLVVAQTTLSFALLVGSGLLIRSVVNVLHLNPGFDTTRTLYFDIALTNARFPDPRKVAFLDRVLPELAALPGVEKVSAGHPLPMLWGRGTWTNFSIANRLNSLDDPPAAGAAVAMPGYFETLSIPLLRGRTFTAHDNDPKAAPVAVVNRAFVRHYFKEEDPIGKYITPKFEHSNEPYLARQIIGVVGDTRTEELWDPYPPQFFLPYGQYPSHQRAIVVMKVSGDPRNYENAVRKVVAAMDIDTPVFEYGTFADSIGVPAAQPRFEAILVSGFAGVALFLSAIGLYAVLSYIVSERVRELGLRIALGASRSDILGIVLRRALILAVIGIGIGASTSVFAVRVINDILFNVEPLDRTVFLSVTVVLMVVSMVAALAPALRAANVDPMRTLREQ